ncbi:hypothetical protein IGI42_000099 [Enterococcus sp. AZ109]
MIWLSKLIFWIPFLFFCVITLSFSGHMTRKKAIIAILLLPVAFFTLKIFNYHHWEPDHYLVYYIIGFVLSTLLLCIVWYFLQEKK